MARAVLALGEALQAEATCPVCLELFSQPLVTECGHSFCGPCLAAVLGSPPRPAACPQCRAPVAPGSLRPNRALRAVAELAEALGDEARRPRCPAHGETLGLFCESCRTPLCSLCREGSPHRHHRARPAEEAAPLLRETLQTNLVFLQKEKEEFKPKGEEKICDLLEKVASERQKLRGTFEQLQQFLREQEDVLLAQLDGVHGDLTKKRHEYVSSVLERKSLLDTLIAEIEKKRDQPMVEFLMDVGKTLSSCEAAKAPMPELVSPGLERTVKNLFEMSQLVMGVVAQFKVNLLSTMDRERVEVTLDPETASPYLALSKDCRTVRLGDRHQNLPNNPKRFTGSPSVLGSQGFTSGRHYWELEVGDGDSWAAGVAVESVRRKDSLTMAMGKIWALRRDWDRQYTALHMPPSPLALMEEARRIRVHLDYEEGQVIFYNAENMVEILQFKASFTEKVFPYFWLWSQETYIQLCS
ncbi:E3 ubiquitin-protein ligase TRIM7-like [Falco biarmicus]|uniref:E3 ubiquitin-protein ligase TRIM7-like n=1 Tax=Falco peregrinus TaxID=8954 RepID=UPI0018867B21|nr:E3 ubiquitin-protein ligase TRIM7-like [Falco peregrinus]XP_037240215.1 E3 ubiquitin-protein ligase TRIM7-like [Falco rusticolus]XP_055562827.1 E3 ubiquitin-protein ligase TRIM7-like [Falco cherrug]XP_056190002.1 E3 ubiquitin-protein ligase TRIM7-like [Falco biarmicus]